MTKTSGLGESVEALIDEVEKQGLSNFAYLPKAIEDKFSLTPEWTIDLIHYLESWGSSINETRTRILFRLIDESLNQIRYSVDRKDQKGQLLLTKVQETLNHIMPAISSDLRATLNQVIFDSKLNIEIQAHYDLDTEHSQSIDIMPKLPELLEHLRREKAFKTVFELYELMLPQIQLLPNMAQLALIAEMAHSKKAIAHELAMLMLLHPKATIRKRVAEMIDNLSDKRIFTPVDLRRLIMIRNWVPMDEREGIDNIIVHLRKNNLSPAPYPLSKLTQLVSSSMDGAGVTCIMMETKKNNQRQMVGFLVKVNVGIREPWVMHKAPKHYLDKVIKEQITRGLPVKPVSKAYVNKMVQHFLAETLNSEKIPEATFIEVAELFGADNWQPQALNWSDEINRLREIYTDKLTKTTINESLQRSGQWHSHEDIASHWFETGDIAQQAVNEAMKKHQDNPSQSPEAIATECLMHQCLDKWKMIFLVTCLWMRSKEEHSLCADLFTVLHCLDNQVTPSSIPLMSHVTAQTLATVLRREMEV